MIKDGIYCKSNISLDVKPTEIFVSKLNSSKLPWKLENGIFVCFDANNAFASLVRIIKDYIVPDNLVINGECEIHGNNEYDKIKLKVTKNSIEPMTHVMILSDDEFDKIIKVLYPSHEIGTWNDMRSKVGFLDSLEKK